MLTLLMGSTIQSILNGACAKNVQNERFELLNMVDSKDSLDREVTSDFKMVANPINTRTTAMPLYKHIQFHIDMKLIFTARSNNTCTASKL